ncbi:MAG: signal peptidase I [Dehalococcoidia bacterium]
MTMKRVVREIVITVLLALLIFMAVRTVAHNFEVSGDSMEPSMHNGQFVMVSKMAYWFNGPERGDIVVYYTERLDHNVIHRVVGMPGETVEIVGGHLYINGESIEEPYILDGARSMPLAKVPEGHYYIVGDNRDQATWEIVPEDDIVGKAWFCYWPAGEWGFVPNYSL